MNMCNHVLVRKTDEEGGGCIESRGKVSYSSWTWRLVDPSKAELTLRFQKFRRRGERKTATPLGASNIYN